MPNWCDNTLHITHENPEMMKKVIDAWNSGEFFQTMRPCPQELIDTSAGYAGETEEQQENERRELVNLEKYGYKNCISYDVDSHDYQDPGVSAVLNNINKSVKGGSIISLQPGGGSGAKFTGYLK